MKSTMIIFGLAVLFATCICGYEAARQKRATGCAAVQIVSRGTWGATTAPYGGPLPLPVKYVFIHHTAGGSCNSLSTCSSVVKGIYNYHKNTNGWGDIGYSFLIGGDGRAYQGRGWDKVGAHTYGWNNGIGISFIGTFASSVPSAAMQNAAKNLIECGKSLGKISRSYGLYGHRDGTCTDCPGNAFYNILNSWANWHRVWPIQKFCSG